MKELIVLLLIGIVIASGCVGQQAGQNQTLPASGIGNNVTVPSGTQIVPEISANLTVSNAALYSDVDSIANEAAGINTTGLDDVMTPITADDLTVD